MDKMSIWSVIFISFPEEIMFVITFMLIAGCRDFVAFLERKTLIKIFVVAISIVASFYIGRYYINSIVVYSIIEIISITIIAYTIFRFNIRNTLIGVINAFIISVLCDVVVMLISYNFLHITGEQIHSDDILLFLLFVPKGVLQFISIVLIIRFKKIDLIALRYRLKYQLYISLLFFVSLGFIIVAGSMFDNFDIAKYSGFYYIVAIVFGFYTIAILLVFSYISEEKKKRLMADKKRDGELERMKQLIHEGKIDQVLDLIDCSRNKNN